VIQLVSVGNFFWPRQHHDGHLPIRGYDLV